ncbi:hypothetical protein [Pseudomonas helvetica]|uniref:hypothetical protein n=1 Tax=Pseudomonas helvetica TaxID=3136738 RepID=UPI003266E65F
MKKIPLNLPEKTTTSVSNLFTLRPDINTEAPLDVLHETAAYRIRTATQLLEIVATGEGIHSELARALVVSLRDGCDLLDVVGRRLQAQVLLS